MNRNAIFVLIGFIISLLTTILIVRILIKKGRKMVQSNDAGPTGTNSAVDQIVIDQATSVQPDDLTRIYGIGPKSASALQEAGIMTFSQLAALEDDSLQEILDRAGVRITVSETWREQADQEASGTIESNM